MKLRFLKLSAFNSGILKDCPTIQYGASFIKYIAYFPVLTSVFSGYAALSAFDSFPVWSNVIVAGIFVILHMLIFKRFDSWLHVKRSWNIMLIISFCLMIISFLQTIIISNYLFGTELQIDKLLRPEEHGMRWLKKDIFYVLSFRNTVVSAMTIAVFVIHFFVSILPFGLTFFYRKSKYYHTYTLIENFKMSYE